MMLPCVSDRVWTFPGESAPFEVHALRAEMLPFPFICLFSVLVSRLRSPLPVFNLMSKTELPKAYYLLTIDGIYAELCMLPFLNFM